LLCTVPFVLIQFDIDLFEFPTIELLPRPGVVVSAEVRAALNVSMAHPCCCCAGRYAPSPLAGASGPLPGIAGILVDRLANHFHDAWVKKKLAAG
jgi:hypothetical protein